MLLDEPFSSLDVELRQQLARDVRNVFKKTGVTAILVTHDQFEAFAMADEIGVMQEGHLRQWDTPYNLYHLPTHRFVADFIGQGVMLPGTMLDSNRVEIELGIISGATPVGCGEGCPVDVLVRPDDVVVDPASPHRAGVVEKLFRGAEYLYALVLPSGTKLLYLAPSHEDHALGENIGIRVDVDHVPVFKRVDRAIRN